MMTSRVVPRVPSWCSPFCDLSTWGWTWPVTAEVMRCNFLYIIRLSNMLSILGNVMYLPQLLHADFDRPSIYADRPKWQTEVGKGWGSLGSEGLQINSLQTFQPTANMKETGTFSPTTTKKQIQPPSEFGRGLFPQSSIQETSILANISIASLNRTRLHHAHTHRNCHIIHVGCLRLVNSRSSTIQQKITNIVSERT